MRAVECAGTFLNPFSQSDLQVIHPSPHPEPQYCLEKTASKYFSNIKKRDPVQHDNG